MRSIELAAALDEEHTVDGARLLFLSADLTLYPGENDVDVTMRAPRLKAPARFVVVQPFAGDASAAALVATTVSAAANGALRFRLRRLEGAGALQLRLDVLLR